MLLLPDVPEPNTFTTPISRYWRLCIIPSDVWRHSTDSTLCVVPRLRNIMTASPFNPHCVSPQPLSNRVSRKYQSSSITVGVDPKGSGGNPITNLNRQPQVQCHPHYRPILAVLKEQVCFHGSDGCSLERGTVIVSMNLRLRRVPLRPLCLEVCRIAAGCVLVCFLADTECARCSTY